MAPRKKKTVAAKEPKKPLLPGFGRPLNYVPIEGPLFPNALSDNALTDEDIGLTALTLRELRMLQFMNTVTDKVEWYKKVNDQEIAKKWKDEICGNTELDFTPEMADWCIDELRHVAAVHSASPENPPPPVIVYNGDVVKSDTVGPELKQALQAAIHRFESAIPEKHKDWHPGSDDKVLDLVHPSLYPLVYGRTRILCGDETTTTTLDDCIELCGQGEIAGIPPVEDTVEPFESDYGVSEALKGKVYSNKFQWLPCEVDISGEGAKITSYINNLHPREEKHIYSLIEKLIDASIPLWNTTLAPLADESFELSKVKYHPMDDKEDEDDEDDEDDDDGDGDGDDESPARPIVQPQPEGKFQPLPQPDAFDLRDEYEERGLQVIVKLANIHLTPEKPEYEGGTWHVEGQMNEHIVSTALYYYSNENITSSLLSFRQQCTPSYINEEVEYRQYHHRWLKDIFGCENDKGAIQEIGSVETREGRLVTFPNLLQHRVDPFKLADPTKPGHRKIVALFLVDPNIKITSTAYVPCQQQAWWWETVMAKKQPMSQQSPVGKVPVELQDTILEDVDFPFSMAEAKALRLELMEERKAFTLKHGEAFETAVTFSLCEH